MTLDLKVCDPPLWTLS